MSASAVVPRPVVGECAPIRPSDALTPQRPWYWPGVADVVFLVVLLIVLKGGGQGMLDDPGLGWHLRNIDAMRQQGGWLTTDPFTDPRGQAPPTWYTNQWLGELPLYLGWKWAGLEGIVLATALVVALIGRCLYVMAVRDGLPWPIAVVWAALGTLGTSCSWVARPNIFTILFVLIVARLCVRFHEGQATRRRMLWLLPLFAVWANTHGGFLAGFIVLGATLLCEVAAAVGAPTAEGRKAAAGRGGFLVALSAGCVLATLLNPYGYAIYPWTLQLLGDKFFMDLHLEWKPPPFNLPGAMRFEHLMLLFPFVLAMSGRRPNLVELGLAVVWLHLALTGFRYVALWVVVAVPLLARASVHIAYLQDLAKRFDLSAGPGSLFHTQPAASHWVGSVVVGLLVVLAVPAARGRFAGYGERILATKALDRVLELHREARQQGRQPAVFHSYDWGGYLTWHGWPQVLNWIDDRNEVQGRSRVEELNGILRAEAGWEQKLANIEIICIQLNAPLVDSLAAHAAWRQVYRDTVVAESEAVGAVIFVRR